MKFRMNVRHRPTIDESIEQRLSQFVLVVSELPPPWGLAEGKELKLPPVGAGLSTEAKLRGKLGRGVAGFVSFRYRAAVNLDDRAADDDAVVLDFDANNVVWSQFVERAFPAYVRAIGAYVGRVSRLDEAGDDWEKRSALSRSTGKDLDRRDGFFRFGPLSFMDRELCRRGCNGMTPEQIVAKLGDILPDVKLLDRGVLLVAADHFPTQDEIVATDRLIRARLGLSVWT